MLPTCGIHAFLQDSEGFLWIGSSQGLFRYDGTNLDVYRPVPGDTASLPSLYVNSLHQDKKGMIWAGTGHGVCQFDPHTMRFQRRPLLRDGETVWDHECILFPERDGALWSTSLAHGVSQYDATAGAFRDIPAIRNVLSKGPQRFSGLVRDEVGVIWVCCHMSVVRYDPVTGVAQEFPYVPEGQGKAPSTLLMGMERDPYDPNTLWIRSWGAGIVRFDKRTGSFTNTVLHDGTPPNISNIIWSMSSLDSTHWLMGIDRELRIYEPGATSFSGKILNGEQELHRHIMTQYVAPDGSLWIGTNNGIWVIPRSAARYGKWTIPISSVANAQDGGYWCTSMYENRRLFHFDAAWNNLYEHPLPDADKLMYECLNLIQLRNGEVWLATTQGLLTFDPSTRTFEKKRLTGIENDLPEDLQLGALTEQPDGRVWFNASGLGLICYDPATGLSTRISDSNTRSPTDSISTDLLGTMDADHLWLRLSPNGFGVLDTRTNELAEIFTLRNPGPGAQHIGSVAVQGGNTVHAITPTNGVYTLHYNGKELKVTGHYRDPLTTAIYSDATADTRGHTWIAAWDGLVRFDPTDGSLKALRPSSGIPLTRASKVFTDAAGRIVALTGGVVRFHPDSIDFSIGQKPMHVRSVSVNGHQRVSFATAFALPHDSNTISIEYAAIALNNADLLHYEVKLVGHGNRWVPNSSRRTASYINLPPGDYTFLARVEGVSDDDPIARVAFTIHPAWWQRGWFRGGAALSVALLIFLLSRYILRLQYKRRIAALEQEQAVSAVRTRISRDIHDEIGSGLTKITMLSRELGKSSSPDPLKHRLADNIATASTDLIHQLSEIVWTNDPSNDLAPRFVAYVRNVLSKQFEELPVELRTDLRVEPAAETLLLGPEVKRNVVLILKEAVSNALKYADAKCIAVRLVIGAAELTMNVQDDGHGFDTAAISTVGNGVQNMQKRAASIGGEYSCGSNAAGTSIELRVPLSPSTIM